MVKSLLGKGLLTVAAIGLSVMGTAPAHADILFSATAGFVQPEENVQFNNPGLLLGPALTIQGATNQSSTIVLFTGEENIFAPSGGQARVQAQDGSFSNLFIRLQDSGLTFTQFESNVNLSTAGLITVTVNESNGQVNTFSFAGTAGGQNFFGVNAINNQQISSINVNATVAMDNIGDVRQIRIGGINRGGVPVVPEPGAIAFAAVNGLGLLGLMVRARRRKLSA